MSHQKSIDYKKYQLFLHLNFLYIMQIIGKT